MILLDPDTKVKEGIFLMIEIINLSKNYGKHEAVMDLNLKIDPGELFGFLGPNGAGKTTTIKILAGVLQPSKGTAIINGIDILEKPEKAKKITGYIPDKPFLYDKLTGVEFLRFIGGIYELEQEISSPRIEKLLDMFELTEWGNELIEGYSHGMKQKLVMSAALLPEPRVIVVDEPMVGLDPKGALLIKQIFKSLCKKGVSIFMSTHSLNIAEELCNRIGIINKGKLIAVGSREELRNQAASQDSGLERIFMQLTKIEPVTELIDFLRE